MSDNMNTNEEEMQVIHLELDNGEQEDCAVIAVFEIEGYDYEYIALVPVADLESDDEESSLYLYRFQQLEDDSVQLDNIEDDAEYNAVADAFDSFFDEDDENEE